jgi:pilus assembly protein FimV
VGKIVLKSIALAAAFCLLPTAVFAAGLGKLTVLSALGQPLRAEIEVVSLQANEADSLTARLASPDTFRQANIELNGALLQVKFSVESRAGKPVVTLTSVQPMNEPFFDMLIELGWASGRLVREYTFLLDPPEYNRGNAVAAPVQPTVPAAIQQPAAPRAAEAPRVVERAPEPRARAEEKPAADPVAAKATPAATYTVRGGDTLGSIAEKNKAEGVTMQQMLAALYRGNSDAFDGGNMNRLRSGRILNLPDRETALAVTPADAGRLVSAQSSEYSKYRRQLGAVVADAPARPDTGRQASGKIGAATDEKAPAPAEPAKDQLKLSKVDESKAGAKVGASAARDDLAAKERALKEANERIALLEKNMADMKKLAQLSSQTGAQLQQGAKQAEPAAKPDAAKAPAPAPEAPKAAAPAEKAAPAVVAQPAAATPAGDASKAAPAPAPAPAAATPPAAAPKAALAKPAVAPPAAEPASFMDELLDNPAAIGGAGGVVILLAGYAAYAVRKKRKAKVGMADIGAVSAEANSVFGASGGANIDTSSSQFQSDFAPAEGEKADAEEIDPIAEADVYMAYGRDIQAEEILKEALGKNPERQPVRLKLMEIYANRKDVTSFVALANEMHAATGGQGVEWAKAAELGLALDPTNTLFGSEASESTAPESAMDTQAPVNPEATLVMSAADFAGAQTAPTGLPTDEPAPALDFDLDLGAEPAVAPTADERTPIDETAEAPVAEAAPEVPAPLDFDLDLGEPAEAPVAAPAGDMPVDQRASPAPVADEGFSIDFELPSSPLEAVAAEPAPSSDLPVIDAGAPTLDFDLGSFAETPAAVEAPALDLSSITLDLGTTESVPPEQDAHWQEVATKLDLAKAYQEMGDKDGAKELLGEVLKEGDAAQQAQARTMLEAVG